MEVGHGWLDLMAASLDPLVVAAGVPVVVPARMLPTRTEGFRSEVGCFRRDEADNFVACGVRF